MWEKEVKAALWAKRPVMIRLRSGEFFQGIPSSCTDNILKLQRENCVVWISASNIIRANQFIKIN